MTGNYYYLISSLPELLIDEKKLHTHCMDFSSEVREHLNGTDYRAFTCLQLPFDNNNIINLFEKNEVPFDKRGVFSEEELTDGLKTPDDLPYYMQQFLDAIRTHQLPAQDLTNSDTLAWFFYDEMVSHPLPFIRNWYSFERTVRNLVAGINSRKHLQHLDALASEHETSRAAMIIGRDDAAEMLLRSNAADFGLSPFFPATEKVIALSRETLVDFEKGLDTLRWDTLNEMTELQHFNAEVIYAFYIKLTIVERWQTLDPEAGQAQLDRLIEELKASYAAPATL